MTLWRAAASLAAPHRREENVPVTILTLSRVMSRLASLAAAVGSGTSATTKVSFLPITPPRSLIRSRTISKPSRWRLPSPASGPVSGSSTPILYSPDWAKTVTSQPVVRATSVSRVTTSRRRDMKSLLSAGSAEFRSGYAGFVAPPSEHCQLTDGRIRLVAVADERERFLGPTTIRFCPLCGGPLKRASVPPDQREQAVCRVCDFVFYLNPKVVAGTIPEQNGQVLLTRRAIHPGHGLWTFPGGFVDFGESVTDAAIRETLEETGLAVELTGLHNVYSYPGSPVIIVYAARVTGGTI